MITSFSCVAAKRSRDQRTRLPSVTLYAKETREEGQVARKEEEGKSLCPLSLYNEPLSTAFRLFILQPLACPFWSPEVAHKPCYVVHYYTLLQEQAILVSVNPPREQDAQKRKKKQQQQLTTWRSRQETKQLGSC